MARPSDEFVLAWNSLVGVAEGYGWRTIPIMAAGPCVLSAGRRTKCKLSDHCRVFRFELGT